MPSVNGHNISKHSLSINCRVGHSMVSLRTFGMNSLDLIREFNPRAYNTLLLSFTASASTYTSFPICLNFSDISAIPCSFSFSVAA